MPTSVLQEIGERITSATVSGKILRSLEVAYEDAAKDPFRSMFKMALKNASESGGANLHGLLQDKFLPFCFSGSSTKRQKLIDKAQLWLEEWTTPHGSPVAFNTPVSQPSSAASMCSASSAASSKHSLSSVEAESPTKRLKMSPGSSSP